MEPKYKRVLLKLSGEAIFGDGISSYNRLVADPLLGELKDLVQSGVDIIIVIGGGNIMRGGSRTDFHELLEVTSHFIGILGSLISALAFRDLLHKSDQPAEVVSPLEVLKIVPSYSKTLVNKELSAGKIVIIGGGTGRTHCSTDTAAALYGAELKCDLLLKATRVDGIYTADPEKDPQAKKFDKISFQSVLEKKLKVMDLTAFSICRDNRLKIRVFNVLEPGNLRKIIYGENIGTEVA